MKTLEQIINSEPIFLNSFSGCKTSEDVMSEFCAQNKYTDEKVLVANYDTPAWEGYAQVLFAKDGKLYEVFGSHCSCYGLEDQWDPEEVCLQELVNRVTNAEHNHYGGDDYGSAVKTVLGLD